MPSAKEDVHHGKMNRTEEQEATTRSHNYLSHAFEDLSREEEFDGLENMFSEFSHTDTQDENTSYDLCLREKISPFGSQATAKEHRKAAHHSEPAPDLGEWPLFLALRGSVGLKCFEELMPR